MHPNFRYYKRSLYQHSLMNLHLGLFHWMLAIVRCNLLQTQYIRCLERNALVSFYNSCCCRSFRDFLPSLLTFFRHSRHSSLNAY